MVSTNKRMQGSFGLRCNIGGTVTKMLKSRPGWIVTSSVAGV